MKYFRAVAPDLAIDLGTGNTLVSRSDKGIIINEPTVIALHVKKMEILAIGNAAKELIGKSPDNIAAVRPLRDGVISDFDLTQALLEHYIHRAVPGITLIAPRLTISVPSGATDVENRAIQDACLQAGARDVYLVEETLASAYGAGLLSEKNAGQGAMILNAGAGTTEVAVVSAYGVITSETMQKGGDELDSRIAELIRRKYDLVIGENTAERLKILIGTLREDRQNDAMEVSGRDLESGMPRSVDIHASDITECILSEAEEIVDRIRATLEKTPPELSADIMKSGLVLTGGGGMMDGLAGYIEKNIGLRVRQSKDPTLDTIRGAAIIMKNIDRIRNMRS